MRGAFDNKSVRQIGARFVKFGASSGLGLVLTLALTALCHEWLRFSEAWAYAITLVIMFFWNFFFLRWVVFPATRFERSIGEQLLRSLGVSLFTRGGEWLAFVGLSALTGTHYLLVIGVVTVISFLVKFFLLDRFVFRAQVEQTSARTPS